MMKPKLINCEFCQDDRGYLVPISNSIKKKIKRVYIVGNFSKSIIRGFHFHKKEWKFFYIARGSAKFIVIDPSNSKKKYSFVLSDRFSQLLIVPPRLANGWMSLVDNTLLVAMSTSTFEESLEDDIRYDPYKWGNLWEVKFR